MFGPTMVLAMLGLAAAFFWPEHGVRARWVRYRSLLRKERLEHTLKHLHHCEFTETPFTLESLAGVLGVSRDRALSMLNDLQQTGMVEGAGGDVTLTADGRREALRVIRIHRLWEKFYAEKSGLDETLWHEMADRREHVTTHNQAERLARSLGHPRFDPHGAPIPTPNGELPSVRGLPLSEMKPGQVGRVVHVEDEPKALHEQLVLQGLNVGALVRVVQCGRSSIQLEVGGEPQVVAPVAAANVSLEPLEMPEFNGKALKRLSRVEPPQKARVVGLLPSCRGIQRRRLLDLGLVPGTVIEPELRSASGSPVAYRVRGALVALREDQAQQIQVEAVEN
jgi:DtxR family Mn-dependent transcriptional regulator